MTAEFVVRVLDAEGALLAWARVAGELRPGGVILPPGPTRFLVEQAGKATRLSVHWLDLDVARVVALDLPADLAPGQALDFHWFPWQPLWKVVGEPDAPLPPVTVRESVVVGVPTLAMGAVGN